MCKSESPNFFLARLTDTYWCQTPRLVWSGFQCGLDHWFCSYSAREVQLARFLRQNLRDFVNCLLVWPWLYGIKGTLNGSIFCSTGTRLRISSLHTRVSAIYRKARENLYIGYSSNDLGSTWDLGLGTGLIEWKVKDRKGLKWHSASRTMFYKVRTVFTKVQTQDYKAAFPRFTIVHLNQEFHTTIT